MNWTIPGTVLKAERQDAQYIPEQFQSMFLAGTYIRIGSYHASSGF